MIARRVLIAVAIGMVLVLINRAVSNLTFVPLIFTGVFLYALFELARPLVMDAFRSRPVAVHDDGRRGFGGARLGGAKGGGLPRRRRRSSGRARVRGVVRDRLAGERRADGVSQRRAQHGAVRRSERPAQARFAAKRWIGEKGELNLTLYYPDRLEYWASEKTADRLDPQNGWKDLRPSAEPATNPYGVVPVFRFRRVRGRCESEMAKVLELQDAVNKLLSDLMVAGEFSAARQRWILSNMDETGSLKSEGGAVWLIPKGDGRDEPSQVGEFAASDLANYGDRIEQLVTAIAIISRTPKHYFHRQGGDPSGEALIAMEAPLTRKVRRYLEQFADTWARVAEFLAVLIGSPVPAEAITVAFAPVQTVQPLTVAQIRQTSDQTGIPLETQLRDEGWTEQEIADLRADQAVSPTFLAKRYEALESLKRLGASASVVLKLAGLTDAEVAEAKAESDARADASLRMFDGGGA